MGPPRGAYHMGIGNIMEDRPSWHANCIEARKWGRGDGIHQLAY